MGHSILTETALEIRMQEAKQQSGRLLHLSIQTNSGSCEHYYHFLLGYLLPFAAYVARLGIVDSRIILLRSCGPLDRILRELALPGLLLCERFTHLDIKALITRIVWAQIEEVSGFDFGQLPEDEFHYDIAGIAAGIDFLRSRLAREIAFAASKIDASWSGRPRVLMIERGEADPFYQSSLAEHRNAAKQRRFIGNHDELTQAMTAAYAGFQNLRIETLPLAEQIAWFGLADIVVAQYGGALSNIVWMRRGANVIEIAPDTRNVIRTVFSKLAQGCGVSYARLPQHTGPFGPVPIQEFARLVSAAARSVNAGNPESNGAFFADRRLAS